MAKELPAWLLPAICVVGVLLIGTIIWNTLTGHNAPVGKDIAVRPGMYDMRAEMAKRNAPRETANRTVTAQ